MAYEGRVEGAQMGIVYWVPAPMAQPIYPMYQLPPLPVQVAMDHIPQYLPQPQMAPSVPEEQMFQYSEEWVQKYRSFSQVPPERVGHILQVAQQRRVKVHQRQEQRYLRPSTLRKFQKELNDMQRDRLDLVQAFPEKMDAMAKQHAECMQNIPHERKPYIEFLYREKIKKVVAAHQQEVRSLDRNREGMINSIETWLSLKSLDQNKKSDFCPNQHNQKNVQQLYLRLNHIDRQMRDVTKNANRQVEALQEELRVEGRIQEKNRLMAEIARVESDRRDQLLVLRQEVLRGKEFIYNNMYGPL